MPTETPPPHKGNINISADVVRRSISTQIEEGKITQEEHDLIWWFFCYAKDQGWDLRTCGMELGYSDSTTPYRIFTGTYGASLDNFTSKVRTFRRLAEERSSYRAAFFVETSVAKRVFQICHAARVSQTVAWVFGDSQIGKTTALEEYTRQHNHGATVYVRLPASAGIQLLAKEIAGACHVATASCFEKLRSRIMATLDHNMLLIVDELHQVFTSYHGTSQLKVMEFLREIYDRTQCGLVLCGTHVLRREMEEGKLALVLEQLRRRGTLRLELPARPGKKDVAKIAAGFDLPAPGEAETAVIRDMVATSGLGMFVKFLQAGHKLATRADEPMTWQHFVDAYTIIRRASKPSKADLSDML